MLNKKYYTSKNIKNKGSLTLKYDKKNLPGKKTLVKCM